MRWIGLDVHYRYIQGTEISESGDVQHFRVLTDEAGVKELQERCAGAKVVLEASTSSFRLHDSAHRACCGGRGSPSSADQRCVRPAREDRYEGCGRLWPAFLPLASSGRSGSRAASTVLCVGSWNIENG